MVRRGGSGLCSALVCVLVLVLVLGAACAPEDGPAGALAVDARAFDTPERADATPADRQPPHDGGGEPDAAPDLEDAYPNDDATTNDGATGGGDAATSDSAGPSDDGSSSDAGAGRDADPAMDNGIRTDSGAGTDTGGPADSGTADGAVADATPPDATPPDATPPDGAPPDAAPTDSGVLDSGRSDAGATDAGPSDAGCRGPACGHPFLLFNASDFATFQARASTPPWSGMRSAALSDAASLQFSAALDYDARCARLSDILSANALAYVLDPPNRSTYVSRILTNSIHIDNLRTTRADDSWTYSVPPGRTILEATFALDTIYDALSSGERSAFEGRVQALLDEIPTTIAWRASVYGTHGVWALYRGDFATYDTMRTRFRAHVEAEVTADGVFHQGAGYGPSRYSGGDRTQKHLFLDVIERQGDEAYYSDPRIIALHEWLGGYAITPARSNYSFGDTSPDAAWSVSTRPAAYRSGRFGARAAGLASWWINGRSPRGRLLTYVLMDQPLPAATPPPSRAFPTGGAWLLEQDAATSLAGALWSPTASGGHSHKDVNAVHLHAYGETVLRNSGYAGWGSGAGGATWQYIHDTAVSSNVALIDQADHASKTGGGVIESLLGGAIELGTTGSGSALSNGRHERSLVLVHARDGRPGYFVLFDELTSAGGSTFQLALHPSSDSVTIATGEIEYRWQIGPQRFTAANVWISIFLATPPTSAVLRDGALAGSNTSFAGRYLYSSYPLTGGAGRAVTILAPEDAAHPKPAFTRVTGSNARGAEVDLGAGVLDTVLESNGSAAASHGALAFQARSIVHRRVAGATRSYLARRARAFDDGGSPRRGFDASAEISVTLEGASGAVSSASGAGVTFYSPGVTGVRIDGNAASVLGSGAGWVRVSVPSGAHSLELF